MKFNEIKINDAASYETFGGDGLKSGAYLATVVKVQKWERDGKCFANFELKINGQTRYVQMWMTRTKDGQTTQDIYNTKRISQMMYLMQVNPSSVQELPSDRANWFDIPQFKGDVGVVIEVKPANAVRPNQNGDQFPELTIISFFDFASFKTLQERTENKPAENVEKMVNKLLEKTYKPYGNTNTNNNSAPPKIDASANLSDDDLPW